MIDFAAYTEEGSREINEDYVLIAKKREEYLFVLADGLGGHGRGEEASKTVAHEIVNYFENTDNFINKLADAFEWAQEKLIEKQQEVVANFEMKTTVVVLVVTEKEIRWGHIGDSRLYMLNKSQIKTRTLDHSVPQKLASAKNIKEEEIRFHPDRNKLIRVMGGQWGENRYELSEILRRKRKTSFLLCSDGFWELIDEGKMEQTHSETKHSKDWLEAMLPIVKRNGEGQNMDNLSAVTVRL